VVWRAAGMITIVNRNELMAGNFLRDEYNRLIEQCARVAETVEVPRHGHPQIDAPTIGDARKVIASEIRKLKFISAVYNKAPDDDHPDWTHPLIREDRPE